MKAICISDTHLQHEKLSIPDGDVLVHAGDFTNHGTLKEVLGFVSWLRKQPHPHKIVVAGNHDFLFEEDKNARYYMEGITYLEDESAEIEGKVFYGSPWQPRFYDWAFNLDRGPDIAEKWELIPPTGIDVLVTHGPPRGFGDVNSEGISMGCDDLLSRVRKVKPRFHVFGHNHEGYGVKEDGGTVFVNASSCNRSYKPVNEPIVLDL